MLRSLQRTFSSLSGRTALAMAPPLPPIRLHPGDTLHAQAALGVFFAGPKPLPFLSLPLAPTVSPRLGALAALPDLTLVSALPEAPLSVSMPYGGSPAMHAIGIIKIRRKKMNKHKYKKHRRDVRDSTRYNKEKRRKSGPMREKQE
ncbi:hypothetical protein HDU98_000468 [Podochytrium sp. JEL0797]|nr:hypothetical protein HDU98_000468 [Podochytrium sp. JEL0797]